MITENQHADFKLRFKFAVPARRLFEALATEAGTKSWWTRFCEVDEAVGGRAAFDFPGAGFFALMRIVRRAPPNLLEWECLDSTHHPDTGYGDLRDWVGTRIRFDVHDAGDGACELDFTHFRLNELECGESCRNGWRCFLDESLRGYLEAGVGKPWDRSS